MTLTVQSYFKTYAMRELDLIGLTDNDPTGESMNYRMREHILRTVEEFSHAGHSGHSAGYALSILKKLLAFEPLSPLTGEDDEWMDVGTNVNGDLIYQNIRQSDVFKENGAAYWSEGRVFYTWYTGDDGKPYKSYFTSRESRVPITEFPWTKPDSPEYIEVPASDD